MIRIINSVVLAVISFGIYSGVQLYTLETIKQPTPQNRIPPIEKKINPPKEAPKSFDWKKLSRMEMIESSDLVLEAHINSVLDRSKYKCMGKNRRDYVTSISSSILSYTMGDLKLALWVAAMAQVESSYRLNADPKISNAKGFLQVIPKWHKKELARAGITPEELATNPRKSIKAGIIVFRRYLQVEHGNYKLATRRYRGLKVSEEDHRKYYNKILLIFNGLTAELQKYA